MKFIHSSDLQIGKAFGYFEPEIANVLQDARQAVVRTLGEAAVKSGATAVLISGDIYEKQQMSQQTLARAIENMRAFTNVQWHLMQETMITSVKTGSGIASFACNSPRM
jgi:DNA repair exonuclease SbcCD nuclease subunit